jgi:glycerophosphoryl diester phosphodiesterase
MDGEPRARRPAWAAHRGGAALWPENSLLAFRNAIASGADLLEFDVRLAGDGEVVVIHDAQVDRTTDGTGRVDETPAARLGRLRLRCPDGSLSDEPVPTLGQVLELAAPTAVGLLLEIKDPGPSVVYERHGDRVRPFGGSPYEALPAKVMTAVTHARLAGRTAVMAFNPEVLARVRALAPGQRTTLLVGQTHVAAARAAPRETVEWASAMGVTDLGLDWRIVEPDVVRAARAAGLAIGVWTVNDEPTMRRMLDLGVDIITTDRPDLARRLVGAGAVDATRGESGEEPRHPRPPAGQSA